MTLMQARPMAVIALCAGLLCSACTGSDGPVTGSGGPAPGGTAQAAVDPGEPVVLARHLAVPWAIAFLPGGDALVTERDSARLLRVTPQGGVSTVGTVPGVDPDGEGGLLGVAVSPRPGRDQVVYLYLSTATDNRIVRFRYSGRNYGWPEVEGAGGGGRFTDPELTWPTEAASPSGAAIAAGSLWVAALRGQRLWQVPLDRTGAVGRPAAHFTGEFGRLRAVVRAPDGSLWFTTSNRDGRQSPGPDDDKILVMRPR